MVKTKHKSKNIGFCTLDGAKCINPIVKLLFKHVPMSIRSSQTPNQFFKVLTSLAIQKLSIHSIQRPGSNIPSENSLHHNLKKIVTIQPPPNQLANIDFDVIGTSDY